MQIRDSVRRVLKWSGGASHLNEWRHVTPIGIRANVHKVHVCALGELSEALEVNFSSVHTRAHAVHIEHTE